MNPRFVIETLRTNLRQWRDDDRAPFAALNADPEAMAFFPGALGRVESDALADRIEAHFAAHDFGLWALEIPGVSAFAGFVGLSIPRFEAAFTPCVEIGWRLTPALWGRGYVTEAAEAALAYGFTTLGLAEIVSFTVPANQRSRGVMQRLGMTFDPQEDFDHPLLPAGHPLARHVLYRKRRPG